MLAVIATLERSDFYKSTTTHADAPVLEERERQRREIRRVRRKLGLSQAQASMLTGGGPNAFSRYELGKAKPLPAVINLLRLLDRHPELLRELPVPGKAA